MIYLMLGSRDEIYAVSGTKTVSGVRSRSLLDTATRKITVGVPPYYKLTGVDSDGKLVLEELPSGSHGYTKVDKWVASHNHGVEASHKKGPMYHTGPAPRKLVTGHYGMEEASVGASSRLILNNNPGLTEEQVRKLLVEAALQSA